jgi:pyruvate-formate lyase-activating enzyme
MELADIIALRPEPCAGLLLAVTQRCPLDCAHCSSDSTTAGPAPAGAQFLRFVETFAAGDRPDVLLMTGGEPLLYPALVRRLATAARRAGTRSMALTGAYFAAQGRYPEPVRRTIVALDHLSVSIDAYHERRVPRQDVFRLLRRVLDAGVAASLHLTGDGPDDPYLADVTAAVRAALGHQVPMLVTTVRPVGRAAAWAAARPASAGQVAPCTMAAWPVVAPDGLIVACCNQDAVTRRPVPAHLALGHVATDGWPVVRRRSLASPELRLIRAAGPSYLSARLGGNSPASGAGRSYCQSCHHLGDNPAALARLRALGSGPAGELLDRHVARVQRAAGPVALLRRHACAPYAHLVTPGRPGLDTEA